LLLRQRKKILNKYLPSLSKLLTMKKSMRKDFFNFLEGGEVEVSALFPAGTRESTAANLEAAANGENHKWSALYPEVTRVADEEGFTEIPQGLKKYRTPGAKA
jgi:rubrerythrin